MKVILSADVPDLGHIGDMVTVKDGYARNFLFPKGLAEPATSRNVKQLEHAKQRIEAVRKRERATAEELKERIEKASVTIKAKVGEHERLYGSVTTAMIADAINEQGFEIDKRKINLAEPIRSTGVFTVPIKIHQDVIAEVKVWVASEGGEQRPMIEITEEEPVAEAPAEPVEEVEEAVEPEPVEEAEVADEPEVVEEAEPEEKTE